jgi:hypothetical protein
MSTLDTAWYNRSKSIESFKILSAVYWWREEDPFHFWRFSLCRSRVIGLDMTENRIFTLCRMMTWVVFLRMFWNFHRICLQMDGRMDMVKPVYPLQLRCGWYNKNKMNCEMDRCGERGVYLSELCSEWY